LHHLEGALLDVLVGGEAPAAAQALAAAPNRTPLAAGAAVDHAVVLVMAERAAHGARLRVRVRRSARAQPVELGAGLFGLVAARVAAQDAVQVRARSRAVAARGLQPRH